MNISGREFKMAKSTVISVRLEPEVSGKLESLAREVKRSKGHLASEAIAAFVDCNIRQIEEIKRGVEEARSGLPGVPHAEVEKWVRSWGTEHELPRPAPKKF
jgi:predicted transcriptional regulator